jgi:hypothetical protein
VDVKFLSPHILMQAAADPQHPENGLISPYSYKYEFKQTKINCKYIGKVAACYPNECSK